MVNFIFSFLCTVRIRITSNADEPLIAIDDCYVGPAEGFNVRSVSQAQFIGNAYFATTANCLFGATSTSLVILTDADCPGPTVESNPGPGTIQTTDVDAATVTVNNLPPGRYEVIFTGSSAVTTLASVANDGSWMWQCPGTTPSTATTR